VQAVPRLLQSRLPLLTLAVGLAACSVQQTHRSDRAFAMKSSAEPIVGITMVDGQEAVFDQPGAQMRGDTMVAQIRGTPFSVPIDQVDRVWIRRRRFSAIATLGGIAFTISIPAVVVGIGFALESAGQ
jgi:hypothetical protein